MWWNAYASTLLRPPLLFNCPRFERQNQKREPTFTPPANAAPMSPASSSFGSNGY
jgi:hypothetical protein